MLPNFKHPPVSNRPRPFWFINGEISREEIRYQIQEMKDKGLGGFFFCARQGLRTPYLSEDWFSLCRFAIDTAKELGLEAWIYDEYPYPSGMSGGEVTRMHPEANQVFLEYREFSAVVGEIVNESLGDVLILSAMAFPMDESGIQWKNGIDISKIIGSLQNEEIYQHTAVSPTYVHNVKRYFTYGPGKELRWIPPAGNWKIMITVQHELDDYKYYGAFLDPGNTDAVQAFLETTHLPYKEEIGGEFGQTVKGIFGDETGYVGNLPWSRLLPDYIRKRFGVEILIHLPALMNSDYPESARYRYIYFQSLHEFLRDRYHRTISKWCEQEGLKYVTEVPSMRASNQMYSHVPSGDSCHDKLGYPMEQIIERDFIAYRSNPKAVSAMAHQFGRKDALIEAFHSIGWTMTLQDAKWQIDRMSLMGITLHNFHAFYYTMNGITKHDAPPSQFLQNPYWEHYKLFADYCARSSYFTGETKTTAKIALFHPVTSWWSHMRNPFHRFAYMGNCDNEDVLSQQLIDDWIALCKTMLFNQIEYEDIDAEILETGRVENGSIFVGDADYNILIVPPVTNLEKSAFTAIQNLLASGGTVVFIGLTPYEVIEPGVDPRMFFQDMAELTTERYYSGQGDFSVRCFGNAYFIEVAGGVGDEAVQKEIAAFIQTLQDEKIEISIPDEHKKGVLASRRENDTGQYVMVSSQDGMASCADVFFKKYSSSMQVLEFDLENGDVLPVASEKMPDGVKVEISVEPWQTRIVGLCLSADTADMTEGANAKGIANASKEKGLTGEPEAANISMPAGRVCKQTTPPSKTFVIDDQIPMQVSIKGDNVYRLEEMEIQFEDSSPFKDKPETIIQHFSKAPTTKNLSFHGGFGTPVKISVAYPISVLYRFIFTVKDFPEKMRLLRDRMAIRGDFEIAINGVNLPEDKFIPVRIYDQNNICADISSFVKMGENEIVIRLTAGKDWHGVSDPLYLLGDFGVCAENGTFVITKAVNQGVFSGKPLSGYPFFSGKINYQVELSNDAVLDASGEIPELLRISISEKINFHDCVRISVNDKVVGTRVFAPYEWNIPAEYLKNEKNQIGITVWNTLANMLEGTYFDDEAYSSISILPEF